MAQSIASAATHAFARPAAQPLPHGRFVLLVLLSQGAVIVIVSVLSYGSSATTYVRVRTYVRTYVPLKYFPRRGLTPAPKARGCGLVIDSRALRRDGKRGNRAQVFRLDWHRRPPGRVTPARFPCTSLAGSTQGGARSEVWRGAWCGALYGAWCGAWCGTWCGVGGARGCAVRGAVNGVLL